MQRLTRKLSASSSASINKQCRKNFRQQNRGSGRFVDSANTRSSGKLVNLSAKQKEMCDARPVDLFLDELRRCFLRRVLGFKTLEGCVIGRDAELGLVGSVGS